MASTDAQKRAVKKAQSKCDAIMLRPPKEEGAPIRGAAAAAGQSNQQYILQAVQERMDRDNAQQEAAGATAWGEAVPLHPEALKAAQAAAEAAGEDLPQFITRAIQTQISEDTEGGKAEENVAAMLRETIQSGTVPEKNRIIIEEVLNSIESKKGV